MKRSPETKSQLEHFLLNPLDDETGIPHFTLSIFFNRKVDSLENFEHLIQELQEKLTLLGDCKIIMYSLSPIQDAGEIYIWSDTILNKWKEVSAITEFMLAVDFLKDGRIQSWCQNEQNYMDDWVNVNPEIPFITDEKADDIFMNELEEKNLLQKNQDGEHISNTHPTKKGIQTTWGIFILFLITVAYFIIW